MATASPLGDLCGIDLGDVRGEYERRGLARTSDAALVEAVAAVVSAPRRPPTGSFVLHSPLELGARAGLLPLVAEEHRHLARLHIVALAAQYVAVEAADLPEPVSAPEANSADLFAAIRSGDKLAVDTATASLAAQLTSEQIVREFTDRVVPLTAAAAHAPIFLFHQSRLHPLSGVSLDLLRPLMQELATAPEARVRWFDGWRPATDPRDDDLADRLANTPLLGAPGSTFIHPLLMQVDESGAAAEHLADVVGSFRSQTARTILRVAAQSMLEDDDGQAPYGWTHCLTLPQAVLGLAPFSADPDRLLAMAATHVMAFRAGLGATALRPLDEALAHAATEPAVDSTELASRAACSHDAHIVKYVLACLDAAHADPEARHLYLQAAQRLLDIWDSNGGDPTDPLG